MKKVTIDIPKATYDYLEQISEASKESLSDVVLRCVKNGMPPLLAKVPEALHEDLLGLCGMSDQNLWLVIEDKIKDDPKKSVVHHVADYPTLRRTFAYSLLKWRGHPMPIPQDFFVK